MKLYLDKYYTPIDLAIELIEQTLDFVGRDNIDTIIEPSAGNGSFSNYLFDNYSDKYKVLAYDMEPEENIIIKQDFLKLDLEYNDRCLIIGNPPFGERNNLARQFYKKSCTISKYIAFILTISQLNNTDSLYEFNLIKSMDLNVLNYSKINIHCCFNIYLYPKQGVNKKNKIINNYIKIYREDYYNYNNVDYDFAICRRGKIGKLRENNLNTQTYKIYCINRNEFEFIKNKILNYDWTKYKIHQSAPSLSKNDLYRILNN